MGLFNRKVGLFSDVIRCDEEDYLVWKWHPNGYSEGGHKREYEIRWGSSLRVKDGEVAVFVYKQKDGTMQDYIVGPFDEKIKTANFPVLTSILGFFTGGSSPFQAEIYFINLARVIQVKFAVPYFNVFDYRHPDLSVPVAARGTLSFRIDDYKSFIKIHRMQTFTLDKLQAQIKDAISRYLKGIISKASGQYEIPVVSIESKVNEISEDFEKSIEARFREDFGVLVTGADIGAIEIDCNGGDYRELARITKGADVSVTEAETAAKVRRIAARQEIEDVDYAETLRINREAAAYRAEMQARSENITAYQIEKQAEVGVAGAEALGHMGDNGAGSVNMGGGGMGFNPAAMMASMAVGGAIGRNIAGVVNNTLSDVGSSGSMPPPVPSKDYYIAIGGESKGPYKLHDMKSFAMSGQMTRETLVWCQGMANWDKAENVSEVNAVFASLPPVLPPL